MQLFVWLPVVLLFGVGLGALLTTQLAKRRSTKRNLAGQELHRAGRAGRPSLVQELGRLGQVRQQLDDLQTSLEEWIGVVERDSEATSEREGHLLRRLFLLGDHVEPKGVLPTELERKGEGASLETAAWRLLQRAFSEVGIERIPVEIGAICNSEFHRPVEIRPAVAPRGTVLQLLRQGYWRSTRNGHQVLRPADVVVSDGTDDRSPSDVAGRAPATDAPGKVADSIEGEDGSTGDHSGGYR